MRWLSAAVLLLAIASPASAEWTKDQRTRFIGSCVEGCQSTPNLPDAGKAAAEDKMTEKMEALSKYFPACARQASGR